MNNDYLLLNEKPLIMGILNITPDSFYDGNKYNNTNSIKLKIMEMIESNVDIIDIGGESTRPGANPLSFNEELKRLEPVLELIKDFPEIVFSVDTYKPKIAEIAIKNGIKIINDITAGTWNDKMFPLLSNSNLKIILMHMKNNPKTMQNSPYYDDIIDSLLKFFTLRIKITKEYGIKDSQIILDPGIGFGKSKEDNFKIINKLNTIASLGYPILIGPSRKSFLQIDNDKPKDRLTATLTSISLAIQNGANIIRVHDVNEVKKCIQISGNIIACN